MKFADLINFETYTVKKEYQFEENDDILDLSKVSETIDIDNIIYDILFIDHEYWIIAMSTEDGFYFDIELENYESHPEISYIILNYLKLQYEDYFKIYNNLPDGYKEKLKN